MTWLEKNGLSSQPPGERLQELIDRNRIVEAPGAHDALAGLLAKRAGFECLYVSGAALTASMGLPDLGVITMDELCFFTRTIYRATDLPLIVDGDTGYGEALNVMRVVRELEDAGAAAIQIEDQELPKKCGHLNDKKLAKAEDMAMKIEAAKRAARHLRIIARTDAASTSMEEAMRRANLFKEAGADIIFPEALNTRERFAEAAKRIPGPLFANMTEFGRTPYMTAREFEELGYHIVIWPVSSLRVSAHSMSKLYGHISEHGGTEGMLDEMQNRADLYDTISYSAFETLDASIAASRVPTVGQED